jgi:hypothetical protein
MEVQFHAFVIFARGRNQWSSSQLSRFTPEERDSPNCIEGWMGPRGSVDAAAKSRISSFPGIKHQLVEQPVV